MILYTVIVRLRGFFISTRLMAALFLVFAAAMAAGTFIENKYNTITARILVYNAWWFEVIMLLFVINFLGNIKRYELLKKQKWPVLLLHLSFILIIVGAFWTRYISFEGNIAIREGAVNDQVLSDKTFLTVHIEGNDTGVRAGKTIEKPLMLSPVTNNRFSIAGSYSDVPFKISYSDFILNATPYIKADAKGALYLKMVEASDGERHDHYLKEGEVLTIHDQVFAFNAYREGAINIFNHDNKYTIQTPADGNVIQMATQNQSVLIKDSLQALMFRALYSIGSMRFVFPDAGSRGFIDYQADSDYKDMVTDDALVVTVHAQGQQQKVMLMGAPYKTGAPQTIVLGNLKFTLSFGSKIYTLPFALKLNDFIAEKYPGTENGYASFESKVTVEDKEGNFDARIFMNNVLDHRGYRFFQSSFHPDEKGTILAVNYDFWGTWITYIGYFLLYTGLLAILFSKNSRFGFLKRMLREIKIKKAGMAMTLLLVGASAVAQVNPPDSRQQLYQIDSVLNAHKVSEEHAAKFGKLIIQDAGGRMKPVNTFSMELLRKVSKRETYKQFNADQVMLSMARFPQLWYYVPIIYLKRGNKNIRDVIGVDSDAQYASLVDFFKENGDYKLSSQLEGAYKASIPNQFQKDLIETDRKVTLLYFAITGSVLRLFPVPNDPNNKWISSSELKDSGMRGGDSLFTSTILPVYFAALNASVKTNNYANADLFLSKIQNFQKRYGERVYPAEEKIDLEILYNRYDVFKKLFSWYLYAGVFMLLFTLIHIFSSRRWITLTANGFHVVIVFLFILHTAGLFARWLISGHAPWSDAYESMIYVGWATMLFGLILGRKSHLTVASTTFVASMILMIAHWNWMDPAIANLQPVLNSYWLMVHVAMIVASYGPFTLGMILGIVALFLMLFTKKNKNEKLELSIKEIVVIMEMSLTVGLVMLTIGNFLGAQWANESWGRYWGWDPKETWAFISIMIYAFVLHIRFIPGVKGEWLFSLMSVLAFYAIMMTYFGVNFYLTGLHSYASGDKVVTPAFVYYSLIFVAVLGAGAYIRQRKLKTSPSPETVPHLL